MLVALLLKTTMKLCKDCRNYNDKDSMCLLGWASPVNGQKTRVYATYARNYEVYCGANAVKFEPKDEELKPCPFCKGVPMKVSYGTLVECANCAARSGGHKTMEDAIAAWNRRVK